MSREGTAKALSILPSRVLDSLDALFQEAQGKGWGYAGVHREVAAIEGLLCAEHLAPPAVILDVGANTGEWAWEAATCWPRATIVCFEPSSHAADLLRNRFRTSDRVDVVQAAVGHGEGTAELYANSPGSALGSLRPRRLEHFGVNLQPQETVPLMTLDSFLATSELERIDLIKIDVEGFELDVLQGAATVLDLARVVQFEWGEASTGSPAHWVDLWYFWRDRGWEIFRITPRGAIRIPRYHPRDEVMTWTNYLALRRGN